MAAEAQALPKLLVPTHCKTLLLVEETTLVSFIITQNDTTGWLAEQACHALMFRYNRELLLCDWSLWKRERDGIGPTSRLWEVHVPHAVDRLIQVMQRVAGWNYETLLEQKQCLISW